jgi:hypothetical protein
MDRYYDIDLSNRRYSEEELQQIRERYLVNPIEEAEGGSHTKGRRAGSAWRAMLWLLSKKQPSGEGG